MLFLAGPTGVGKTELAKGIASLVLGGDAQPLRFDMSEFRADEAHQRLIGAPPGYVGYDAGGELTNAVRANPVCILLFDEIEKATRGFSTSSCRYSRMAGSPTAAVPRSTSPSVS